MLNPFHDGVCISTVRLLTLWWVVGPDEQDQDQIKTYSNAAVVVGFNMKQIIDKIIEVDVEKSSVMCG